MMSESTARKTHKVHKVFTKSISFVMWVVIFACYSLNKKREFGQASSKTQRYTEKPSKQTFFYHRRHNGYFITQQLLSSFHCKLGFHSQCTPTHHRSTNTPPLCHIAELHCTNIRISSKYIAHRRITDITILLTSQHTRFMHS